MRKDRFGPYSAGIIMVLAISAIAPVFAEVESIQTDSEYYLKTEKIQFSGTVEQGSEGLVTIVIRDANDKFIMLTQALINQDNTFEKALEIKKDLSKNGSYKVIAFILSMDEGDTTNFEIVSLKPQTSQIENEVQLEENDEESQKIIEEPIKYYEPEPEIVSSASEPEPVEESGLASFVDPEKDPQYYVDRYYSEESYKSWFDRNYPNMKIEDAVGYEENKIVEQDSRSEVQDLIENDIIPEAEAASTLSEPNQKTSNSEIAQVSLAVAGLGILFAAVYGIKRKVDNNSRQISINRDIIKKKIIRPIMRNNPQEILQIRLARGEISLEEYEKLKAKLR